METEAKTDEQTALQNIIDTFDQLPDWGAQAPNEDDPQGQFDYGYWLAWGQAAAIAMLIHAEPGTLGG